jgi:ATP-dependent exoDNAse (exonuclease V) beta subunit
MNSVLRGGKDKRDRKVIFDEASHTYTVSGKLMKYSVTQLVGEMFHKFDDKSIATTMVQRDDFWTNDKYTQYWDSLENIENNKKFVRRAVRVITKMWAENGAAAAAEGTIMHKSIESYLLFGTELPDTKESKMFLRFHKYMANRGYVPYRSEQVVWDIDYYLAGSVDMMYIHETDIGEKVPDIYLIDWKRSKEISQNGYGKTGIGIMAEKSDCNYEHYSLQLNIYKHLLEKNYRMRIVRMALVILHPNQDDYIKINIKSEQKLARKVCRSLIK